MDGVLSQEEITALLQNGGDVPGAGTAASGGEQISADECRSEEHTSELQSPS